MIPFSIFGAVHSFNVHLFSLSQELALGLPFSPTPLFLAGSIAKPHTVWYVHLLLSNVYSLLVNQENISNKAPSLAPFKVL